MENTRPTIMEVSLDNFKYNIEQIKKYVGKDKKIMPVIKANAYGTWINKVNEVVNDFDIVAVATVDEAIGLRDNGYKKEILILNQPYKDEIEKIIKNNISVGVCSKEFMKELEKFQDNKIKIHIEIETGMGRTGINIEDEEEFINNLNDNVEIEGIYTHLSSADSDDEYTKSQIAKFEEAIDIVEKTLKKKLKYIHCSASNGILNYPNSKFNLVRPGIIMYGYESYDKAMEKIDLKPVCKLKSKITFLKEVPENTSISYNRTFKTNRKTKVATIPIGYADGLRRALSNKGKVVINGKKAPIIGNVCMDGCMVDVTDIENVKEGNDVYIWDNENITVEDIANECNTINYEILSTVSYRVPRIFI